MKDEKIEDKSLVEAKGKKKAKKPAKKNKKAPGIFAKKYKPATLEKKVYKRIFVKEDLAYAKTLFVENKDKKGRVYFAVPKDMRFTKKEVKRLKTISKEVKSQKGRVKLLALGITAAVIAAIIILFSLFKNILVKKAVKSGCEAAFGAVCDIGSVSFKPLEGYLSINNLEIADKSSPWTNLVQFDRITSDFDLTLLLQGKFIVEEMSVTGIQTGTARKTDGTLAPKEKKEKKPKEEKVEEPKEPSKLSLMASGIADEMQARFMAAVDDLFAQYDPEKLINQFYSKLTLPGVVTDAVAFGTATTQTLTEKVDELQKTASELEKMTADVQKTADEVIATYNTVANMDISKGLENADKVKAAYDTVVSAYDTAMSAYDTSVAAYNQATGTVDMVKAVAADVQTQYGTLTKAFDADSGFLKGEIATLKGLTVSDGFAFLAGTCSDLVKTVLGEYYGYIEMGIDYIKSLKSEDKPKTEKKKPAERDKGRTITFTKHNEPTVWIKHIEGSGPKLQFTADNISSDEKAAGAPCVLDFNGHDLGFAIGETSGSMPGMAATTAFDLSTTIHDTGAYAIAGSLAFDPFSLYAGYFEPEAAVEIVNSVFNRFNATTASFTAAAEGFGKDMAFTFDTDMGTLLWNAVQTEWNERLEAVKQQVLAEAQTRLQAYVDEAVQSLTGYTSLESAIAGYTEQIEGYKKQLEEKKNELQSYATGAVDNAKAEAERLAKEAEEKARAAAKAAEDAARAEADRIAAEAAAKAKAAEEAARAEAERIAREAEEAARREAEKAAAEAASKAADALGIPKFW